MENFLDLQQMKLAFFGTDPVADLDSSGEVEFGDLTILKLTFLAPPGPSGLFTACNTATELAATATTNSALQPASLAVDDNMSTRWETVHGVDPGVGHDGGQLPAVDLEGVPEGALARVGKVDEHPRGVAPLDHLAAQCRQPGVAARRAVGTAQVGRRQVDQGDAVQLSPQLSVEQGRVAGQRVGSLQAQPHRHPT